MDSWIVVPINPQIQLSNNPVKFLSGWVGQKSAGGEVWFGHFSAGKFL
jgi:hypothetical protein